MAKEQAVEKVQLAIQTMDMNEMQEMIADNLDAGVSIFDLPPIKVPAGEGAKMWSIPGLGEDICQETFQAVILRAVNNRSYYPKSISETGGGEAPDCSSNDGLTGSGNKDSGMPQDVPCKDCPNSQWLNDEKPKCQQSMFLYVLQIGSMLPNRLQIPVTSMSAFKKYKIQLTSAVGKSYKKVVTEFGLVKVKGTPDYYVATFTGQDLLDKEGKDRVKLLTEKITPIFEYVPPKNQLAAGEDQPAIPASYNEPPPSTNPFDD